VAFLGVATVVAGVTGAEAIWIGANLNDHAGFPDCRGPFLGAWEDVASIALDRPITVEAPLLEMSKREIVQLARAMALPLDQTWSCYRPQPGPRGVVPCGRCDACRLRAEALQECPEKGPGVPGETQRPPG